MRSVLGRLVAAVDRPVGWLLPVVGWLVALWWATVVQRHAVAHVWGDAAAPGPFDLRLWATDGRIRFDSDRFIAIAERGYVAAEGDLAVFPVYPMLIRAGSSILDGARSAAVVVSLVASLATVLLTWAWTRAVGLAASARLVVLALLLAFPWMFIAWGVAYSDLVLVALTLAALLLVERGHPVVAVAPVALAAVARPNGVAVAAAVALVALERGGALVPADAGHRWHRERFRWAQVAPVVGLVALAGWMAWNADRTGDPLYFANVQASYGHRSLLDPLTWLKANLVTGGQIFLTPLDPFHELASLLVVIAAVAAVVPVARRLGWGYGLLVAALVVQVWGAASAFAPAGRYLLPALPIVAAVAAPWLAARPRLLAVVLVAMVAGQTLLTWGFAGPLDPIINQAAW